jgi:hypothetical protein
LALSFLVVDSLYAQPLEDHLIVDIMKFFQASGMAALGGDSLRSKQQLSSIYRAEDVVDEAVTQDLLQRRTIDFDVGSPAGGRFDPRTELLQIETK